MKTSAKALAKAESKCCNKLERKGRACSGCPVMELLGKKERKRRIEKARRRLAVA